MEKLMLITVLVGSGLLVFRHMKNLMTKGEQEKGCRDCALNHLITSRKDKGSKHI